MEKLSQDKILKQLSLGYSFLRSAHFATQGFFLPWVEWLATGENREKPVPFKTYLATALPKIKALFESDSENIASGLYPIQVLEPENPIRHFLRIPSVVRDAFRASRRRQEKRAKDFNPAVQELIAELPEYYRRNFHYQSDGYMGETSAKLYEHQVEVLFSGSADAMRRATIVPLKQRFHGSQGEGLHFLEIGSGTGRLTKFMALAFPKAKITCVDLSTFYLKAAAEKLKPFHRIDFVQGAGEQLNFKSHTFDAVYSCFLFHELPKEVRLKMMKEARRLLKSEGIYVNTDSLQLGDDSDLDWALKRFPKDFHEPFYRDYTQNPLEDQLSTVGFHNIQSTISFLAKTVQATATE